jgi:hypothetical protein
MRGNNFTVLWVGVCQNVLNEIVSILVTCDCSKKSVPQAQRIEESTPTVNEGNARTISTSFTDPVEITLEKFRSSNLKTFFNYLRGKLIHTVLCRIANNVVNSAATVGR